MKINLVNKGLIREGLAIQRIEKLIKEIVRDERKRLGEIGVILLDDKSLLEINKSFLGHHYYTDVITFDYNKKDIVAGDIFISIDTVRSNADKYGQDFKTEMIRVMIHGVLHLHGYDDKSDAERKFFREKEDFYICRFNALKNE